MKCAPLQAGALAASAAISGVDAMWVWADATGLREHLRPGESMPTALPVVVELAGGATLADLSKHCRVPAAHPAATQAPLTAMAPLQFCREVLAGQHTSLVSRIELALPVVPQRPRPRGRSLPTTTSPPPATRAQGGADLPVLLGVIDSGCPFAHRMLRNAAGTGTRVLRLWDQDADAPAFVGAGGTVPIDFGYGAEIDRPGLEALMAQCAAGLDRTCIDEARCYALAGYELMRWNFSHGAAGLGLMLAPRPLDEGAELIARGPAAGEEHAQRGAAQTDLVFVQTPRDAVQDSSSASLSRYVIDGLRYILRCAAPGQRVVINISDGSSRGSHDGQSMVERAMVQMIAEQAAAGRAVQIVIAAGNTFDEERHAQFDALAPGSPAGVTLRVPPDNETSVFVTLRLPAAASGLRVRVTPPSAARGAAVAVGGAVGWTQGGDSAPAAGLVLTTPPPGLPAMGLLAISATRRGSAGQPVAPAGDWLIEVEATASAQPLTEPVHLWISRGQRNAAALPRARQARFVDIDRTYDPNPNMRPLKADPVPAQSPIRRAGTLNSLATGPANQGVVVVGAYERREGAATPYTSAGPAAGAPQNQTVRRGPDLSAATDDNLALRSLRLAGNASGMVLRGAGTSFAAPQESRRLAGGVAYKEPPTDDPERLGDLRLPPRDDGPTAYSPAARRATTSPATRATKQSAAAPPRHTRRVPNPSSPG